VRSPTATEGADAPSDADPDLVYDVGMHRGEDTAFYLARGYRVVGIEANAALVHELRQRFRAEIRSGRVTVLPVAVGPEPGAVRFAAARENTIFGTANSSFIDAAERTGTTSFDYVEVEMTTLDAVVREHGLPYYLKVDIEGLDRAAVGALARLPARPPLLSIESATAAPGCGAHAVVQEIQLLHGLGYRAFKLVDQSTLGGLEGTLLDQEGRRLRYVHDPNASGPFGAEAPGRWRPAGQVLPGMLVRHSRHQLLEANGWLAGTAWGAALRGRLRQRARRIAPGARVPHHWYDLHAQLCTTGEC
jgi:FkbM family methyltransferase